MSEWVIKFNGLSRTADLNDTFQENVWVENTNLMGPVLQTAGH